MLTHLAAVRELRQSAAMQIFRLIESGMYIHVKSLNARNTRSIAARAKYAGAYRRPKGRKGISKRVESCVTRMCALSYVHVALNATASTLYGAR